MRQRLDFMGKLVALAGTLVSLLAACVFFVPSPSEGGGVCALTKEEKKSTCGQCVAEKCQDALDACCAEGKACEGAIRSVVFCPSDESECADGGENAAASRLRTCASTSCKNSCVEGGTPSTPSPPSLSCRPQGTACVCIAVSDGGEPVRTSCPASASSSYAKCCAEEGYPNAAGSGCICLSAYCVQPSPGSCACGYYTAIDKGARSSCSVSSGVCCRNASNTSCGCDSSRKACGEGFIEVDTCGVSTLGCVEFESGKRSVRTTSCSP